MTISNWEVFHRDPRGWRIPNDGVTKVGEPETTQAWDVLRHELSTFVCDGQYKVGLERILGSYLTNLSRDTQPAVWVSGFYGSGKSHLVRVLEYLWRDIAFPDGSSARSLVTLPREVEDLLRELSAAGKREGGLWAAAGTLGASAGESVRLAVVGIMLKSAGLPDRYPLGKFCLWLHQRGLFDAVKAKVEAQGEDFDYELSNLYASPVMAKALLDVNPSFAGDEREAREIFRSQFARTDDISEEEMLETLTEVMRLKSTGGGKLPCTLLILDELQQYLGENTDRTLQVQNIVEACSQRFRSQVLVVATGQSAIQGTVQLSKLQGRFTIRIELTDTDVEKVLRQVVLRKAPAQEPTVRAALEEASGEIDRQLHGTRIAPNKNDRPFLSADYPLLPSRRRFWERALVAVDKAGSAGQLRAQLRIVHESLQAVADNSLGTVVPGDAIYSQLSADMISQGVLPRQIDQTIRELDDGTPDGILCSRLCALAFLVNQLPVEGLEATGVRPTLTNFVDLLVMDLQQDSAALRRRVPALLERLTDEGILMQTFGEGGSAEYRMQTTESREWEQAYRALRTRTLADDGTLATARTAALKTAVESELKRLSITQGQSRTPRTTEVTFAADAPRVEQAVPIWVRDEWATDERSVKADAANVGVEDATVFVFLPKRRAEDLKTSLAGARAAAEVLESQGHPTTAEGITAKNAMSSRQQQHELHATQIITEVIANAHVYQGGGTEVTASSFRESVQSAAERAAVRLYRDFRDEDPKAWGRVLTRARQRNPDPLSVLPYQGETRDHPVASQVLAFVGSGKRGSEVRSYFTSAPYGWPKEAVEGSLLALLVADQLSATHNGSPVTVESLESGKLGQSEFRSVSTVITTPQRIKIRGLLGSLGVKAKPGDEAVDAPQFVSALTALARSAGADAPAPAAPQPPYLEALRSSSGNELLMALYSHQERLAQDIAAWQAAKTQLEARLPRWGTLERLLQHASSVEGGDRYKQQADAIRTERALLNDPDPVPPLAYDLSTRLRETFTAAFKRYQSAYFRAMDELTSQNAWGQLPEQEAALILRQNRLIEPKLPDVSTETRLLEALGRFPLESLNTSIAALPTRVGAALTDANQVLEPKAVPLQFPKTTLKTEAEAERYVGELKDQIMRHINEGRPVIL